MNFEIGDIVEWRWYGAGGEKWLIGLIISLYGSSSLINSECDILILDSSESHYNREKGKISKNWDIVETGLSAEHFFKSIKKLNE